MAKIRYAVLENDKAIAQATTSGVETIDLPESGILSNVMCQFKASGTYTDNMQLPMYYIIKKIELLVNGSQVVKSLAGDQIRALMWYSGGPFAQTNDYLQASGSNYAYHMFPLYMGRTSLDTKLGLDLDAYTNPQLKITWDTSQTAVNGVTWDNRADPTFTYNIMAKLFDGRPAGFQNKYVQSSQLDEWTCASNTERGIEIPRGQALRGLMMQGSYLQKGLQHFFEKTKLDFDNGKYVPIDMDYENLKAFFLDAFPQACMKSWYWSTAHGDDFNSEMFYVSGSGVTPGSANGDVKRLPIIYYGINTVDSYDTAGAIHTGQSAASAIAMGWGPHQTIYIPMRALMGDGVETVDTTAWKRIDLKLTSGTSGSSATNNVVAEYEVPNGQ